MNRTRIDIDRCPLGLRSKWTPRDPRFSAMGLSVLQWLPGEVPARKWLIHRLPVTSFVPPPMLFTEILRFCPVGRWLTST